MTVLPWMLYASGISALFALAAHLLEGVFASFRWPLRFLWLASTTASLVVPWIPARVSVPGTTWGPSSIGDAGVWVVEAVSDGRPLLGRTYVSLDLIVAGGWTVASILLALWTLTGMAVLRSNMRRWGRAEVHGQQVRVSSSSGPAVSGFLRSNIVIPTWLLSWEKDLQDLVLRHEHEHIRAGDPLMRLLALLARIACPWNPVLWWQHRRLDLALEYDCDARVLSKCPQPDVYGTLLLRIATAAKPARLGLPGFSPTPSTLERRVNMILGIRKRPGAIARMASVAIAALSVVGAVSCSGPDAPSPGALTALADRAEPQFAVDGRLVLPGMPPAGKLKEELQAHHPGVLENGVPDGETVWFIVDDDLRVLRTGIGPSEGLGERLMRAYPAQATEFALNFIVAQSTGEALPFPVTPTARDAAGPTVPVYWMVQPPRPGTVPGLP